MDDIDLRWRTPRPEMSLADGEVHVWRVPLERPVGEFVQLQTILAPEERTRAAAFFFEKDRHHWTVARATLRLLLGRYLQAEPHRLQFTANEYGKPTLTPPFADTHLHFNLSHSGTLALYAFAYDRQLGVDVEYMRTGIDYQDLAAHYFSLSECATLHVLPAPLQEEAFFLCWTRKEAYIKARGMGLSLALDQFDVSLTPGEPAVLLDSREEPGAAARWSLQNLVPGPQYAGALAVASHDWELCCWQWTDQLSSLLI